MIAKNAVILIVQIETMPAFDQLEAIASVPGVDSIFIGPADLSFAHPSRSGLPPLLLAVEVERCG
jgi:4-hydroxy-2-oxoheptanedioate aldolase